MIDKGTGVCLKPSACRTFLKKMGMKCRRCGVVPGKAMEDDKQRQAQQEFHDSQLQPILDQAKHTVLFVEAAHFVMGGIFRDGLVFRTAIAAVCQQGTKALNIELLYLPAYSPNLNLIERLWRFIKKQVLYSEHYNSIDTFRKNINICISKLGTRFKNGVQSLMTMNFLSF
jgi:hypothetical protein